MNNTQFSTFSSDRNESSLDSIPSIQELSAPIDSQVHQVTAVSATRNHAEATNFLASTASSNHEVTQVSSNETATLSTSLELSVLDAKQARLTKPARVPGILDQFVAYCNGDTIAKWKSLMITQYEIEHGSEPDTLPLNKAYGLTGLNNEHGNCYMNASLQLIGQAVITLREKGTPDEKKRMEESLQKMPQFKKFVEGTLVTAEDCKRLHQEVAAILIEDFNYSVTHSFRTNLFGISLSGGTELAHLLAVHLNLPPLFFEKRYVHCFDFHEITGTKVFGLGHALAKETCKSHTPTELVDLYLHYYQMKVEAPLPTVFVIQDDWLIHGNSLVVQKKLEPITIIDNQGTTYLYQPIGINYLTEGHAFSIIKKEGSWHEVNDTAVSPPFSSSWMKELEHTRHIFNAVVYEKIDSLKEGHTLQAKGIDRTSANIATFVPDTNVAAVNRGIDVALEMMNFGRLGFRSNFTQMNLIQEAQEIEARNKRRSFFTAHKSFLLKELEPILADNKGIVIEKQARVAINQAQESMTKVLPEEEVKKLCDTAWERLSEAEAILTDELAGYQLKKEASIGDPAAYDFWTTSVDTAAFRQAVCKSQVFFLKANQFNYEDSLYWQKNNLEDDPDKEEAFYNKSINNREENAQMMNGAIIFHQEMLAHAPEKFKTYWKWQLDQSLGLQHLSNAEALFYEVYKKNSAAMRALAKAIENPVSENLETALLQARSQEQKWREQTALLGAAKNKETMKTLQALWEPLINQSKNEQNVWGPTVNVFEAWNALLLAEGKNDVTLLSEGVKTAHLAAVAWEDFGEFMLQISSDSNKENPYGKMRDFWNQKAAEWLEMRGKIGVRHRILTK